MPKLFALTFALTLFSAGSTLAGDAPSQENGRASGGATAAQGGLEREAQASRALFDRLDKNRDGYLTGGELTSMEALSASWISVDRDRDARIARSEFTSVGSGAAARSAVQR